MNGMAGSCKKGHLARLPEEVTSKLKGKKGRGSGLDTWKATESRLGALGNEDSESKSGLGKDPRAHGSH
jgi:hypothetical protein